MTSNNRHGRRRPSGPALNQPGTLRQQIACINHYLRLPDYFRRRDPEGAKFIARWHALPHFRRRRDA